MAEVKDVVAYICQSYPERELSEARLIKIVYLADWKASVKYGNPITEIVWLLRECGPYSSDVCKDIEQDSSFYITKTPNLPSDVPDKLIRIIEKKTYRTLSSEDRRILDFVINWVSRESYSDLIKLVNQTYPVEEFEQGSVLDLADLGQYYRQHYLVKSKEKDCEPRAAAA